MGSLSPPFLVTKPPFFPPPMLRLVVVSARGLTNGSPFNARPVNSYIRFKLGSQRHQTKVVKMSQNPSFDESKNNACHLVVSPSDEVLVVQVLDWKPVKHRLLAESELALGMFTSVGNGENPFEVVVPLTNRWGRNATTGELKLRIGYENMFAWWVNAEMKARDDAATAKRIEEGQDKISESESESEQENGEGGVSWWKFW